MSKDFSKYSEIINNFRGQVLKSDFESKFNLATKSIAKTERFLLKMELKRLAQPCTRLIDLRGLVDGECRSYEHDGRPHFLDDVAIKVFEDNVAYYGNYTFGVYEAVTNTENNFRVIYQREKSGDGDFAAPTTATIVEKTQFPAKLYSFGPYHNRKEERMNFAISFEVAFNERKKITCTSSDLSVDGCKFRLAKAENIKIGQIFTIRFTGLEQEFQFGDNTDFSYEIRHIKHIDGAQLIGAERIYSGDKRRDSFRRFLVGFVQGNKRRYKINLDNTIKALQARTFEQYLLPKINELPVFFTRNNDAITPRYALTCHDNRNTYEYWLDDKKQSMLLHLFNKERLERLIELKGSGKSLTVFSFIHSNRGQLFFYTADELQLAEDPQFMKQFLGFAAAKKSFAVFQLTLFDVNSDYADSFFTLSDSLEKKNAYLNDACPSDVMETLNAMPYIGVVADITTPDLVADYQEFSFHNIDMAKVKAFGHKRFNTNSSVDPVGISYNNHRKEPRFNYKTPVVVEIEKVTWTGTSDDFSVSGMKIELDKSSVLMKGDIVYLSFPKLQKITSSFELKKLPYEVMRVNKDKTIINLRVYVEQHQHIGRAFFKLLIEKNKNKLTEDEYVMMTPGLAKSLRNIYSRAMLSSAIMIQTSGSRYKYETLTTSNVESPFIKVLNDLSDQQGRFNLYPLLKSHITANVIDPQIKQLQASDAPFTEVLYIAVDPNNSVIEKSVITKLSSELATSKLKKMFISKALAKGWFFCIEIKVMRADEPDIAYLNPELSYVSSYAIHRGKQLEQEIYSVVGMVQFFDITQEAMLRYDMMNTRRKFT